MNPQSNNRGPGFGQSMRTRIIIVLGGAVLLIIVAMVIISLLSSSDGGQKERMIEVARAQNEIIRISTLGKDKAKGVKAKNLAVNTRLSVTSSQNEIKGYLRSNHGMKDKAINGQLTASKNSKNDQALDEAARNNRFDETFETLIAQQLADYQKLLDSAAAGATNTEKQTILTAQNSNKLLLPKTAAAQ